VPPLLLTEEELPDELPVELPVELLAEFEVYRQD
jgi:hypothetical protein